MQLHQEADKNQISKQNRSGLHLGKYMLDSYLVIPSQFSLLIHALHFCCTLFYLILACQFCFISVRFSKWYALINFFNKKLPLVSAEADLNDRNRLKQPKQKCTVLNFFPFYLSCISLNPDWKMIENDL